jgi:hypothetical protein
MSMGLVHMNQYKLFLKIAYENVDGGWAKKEKTNNNASQLHH